MMGPKRQQLILALSASIGLLVFARYLVFAASLAASGRHAAAIGFLLVAGLSAHCVVIAALLAHEGAAARLIDAVMQRHGAALSWLLCAIIAIPVLLFTVPDGWDEARHISYGMFLRGHAVSGELLTWLVVRSPLASFLSAIVFPYTQLINPLLLAGLVGVMIAWCRRYSHSCMVVFALILFVANNHFMHAIWAVMGELPGALFLVSAFYLLARQKFALCAACFALAVLARWNLAPFAVIGVIFAATRISLPKAALMAAIGGAIFLLWLLHAWYFVGPPIQLLRDYAVHAHEFTDGSGLRPGVRPTILGRLEFYGAAYFYQTLPALLAIPMSLFVRRTAEPRATGELFRFWLPGSLIVYFGFIACTGGFYPRLAVVTLPLSLMLLAEVTWAAWHHHRISPGMLLPLLLALLPIGAATGVQNYDVVESIGRKILVPPPLPLKLAEAVRQHTTKRDLIVMPQFYKITRQSAGRHLRVHMRRDIVFFDDPTNPSFELMFERSLEDEIRDFGPRVGLFLDELPRGAFYLLPAQYRDQLDPATIIMEEEGWLLGRLDSGAATDS
jgi:hypothetical protein